MGKEEFTNEDGITNLPKYALWMLDNPAPSLISETKDSLVIEDGIGGHEILFEECNTKEKILYHVYMMSEKAWFNRKICREFIEVATDHHNLSIHN